MGVLGELLDLGQSIWYDNISRGMVARGDLAAMINAGLTGVTSNPTIFEKAITGSKDYTEQLTSLFHRTPVPSTAEIIQELMISDITAAADTLVAVYDRTHGYDGYVSIEVTPSKARDTAGTMEEVRYLWKRVNRLNLMVKIPATVEGLPAIEQMLYEGININVTLIFSVERYRQVAEAYLKALERRVAEGKPLESVASVASVFVSRIDTMVDATLDAKVKAGQKEVVELRGKAAVANTKMVYKAFREIFMGPRFAALAEVGAQPQRPLWGSTGTKDPAYSDLKYVETLVGPNTVNTVPPQTYDAILDHCKPKETITLGVPEAETDLAGLAKAGIDMAAVTTKLEEDGVASFERSFDGLSAYLNQQRQK